MNTMYSKNKENEGFMDKIKELKNYYKFMDVKDDNEVERYLSGNEDLVDILMGAVKPIQNIFGNPHLVLNVHAEYLDMFGFYTRFLFLLIKTDCDILTSRNRENELYAKWFTKYVDELNGRLYYLVKPTKEII